jgi:predicted RNase H-like HicB family nuclease
MVYNMSDYYRIVRTLREKYDKIRSIEKPLPEGMWGKDKNWICSYCNIEECNKVCLEIHGKTREELRDENQE